MKTNQTEYAVYPLVVLAGCKTTVVIDSKMSSNGSESGVNPWEKIKAGGPFSPKRTYVVTTIPRETYQTNKPSIKELAYRIENGYLVFEAEFAEEQEHLIYVDEMIEQEKVRLTLFKLYSVYDDLYHKLPFKGELHMHSNWSDGRQPPSIMYAYARRAGMEFAALTDHYQRQPSDSLKKTIADTNTGLTVYAGEEVHKLGQKMHILSIGADVSISKMLEDDFDRIKEEAMEIANDHASLPKDVDPLEYGLQRWVFDQIKKHGGIAVLAHPYWPHEKNPAYLPISLSRLIIEEGYADAWEIVGVDDGDKDFLQSVLYAEEREKGIDMPVIGTTDAHDKAGLGNGFSLVFSEHDGLDAIKNAICNNDCVGVRQYVRDDGVKRFMAFGPTRLVRYALFLLNEFYSVQDRLCFLEGELMFERFTNGEWAQVCIEPIAQHIHMEKKRCFGRKSVL